MDTQSASIQLHKKMKGKIQIALKNEIQKKEDLALVYTPGVGAVASYLAANPEETNQYTWRGRCVAVISDGSAVLGLGNIGVDGAYPVMEGKCALFKRFAGLDAVPIVLGTQNPQEIIDTVCRIAPSFGAINLEDIAAPHCFLIERELRATLQIPVIHDDQWGTAVVVLAGVINALKVVNKTLQSAKIVVNGAGAAGASIVKILHAAGARSIVVCDSEGIIYHSRPHLSDEKKRLAEITNSTQLKGLLAVAVAGADVLIGVSKAGSFAPEHIRSMSSQPVVFALANPIPEILPDIAREAGAHIVSTGRSDFPNQVNNALAFPGIFKGMLDHGIKKVDINILIRAAQALASIIAIPTPECIIPSVFDDRVVRRVSDAIGAVPVE